MKALSLSWRATAMAAAWLAAAQMQPQLATALAVGGDVLAGWPRAIDAFVTDGCLAGDLHGAPLICR